MGNRQELAPGGIPDFPAVGKRLIVDDYAYKATARGNRHPVSTGSDRMIPVGFDAVDGVVHDVDALFGAIGFKSNQSLWLMAIVGRSSAKAKRGRVAVLVGGDHVGLHLLQVEVPMLQQVNV